MLVQLLNGRVIPRQFRLGKNGVDFGMTDGVENGDGSVLATLQLRREVVTAFEMLGDLAPAEGTDLEFGHSRTRCFFLPTPARPSQLPG